MPYMAECCPIFFQYSVMNGMRPKQMHAVHGRVLLNFFFHLTQHLKLGQKCLAAARWINSNKNNYKNILGFIQVPKEETAKTSQVILTPTCLLLLAIKCLSSPRVPRCARCWSLMFMNMSSDIVTVEMSKVGSNFLRHSKFK